MNIIHSFIDLRYELNLKHFTINENPGNFFIRTAFPRIFFFSSRNNNRIERTK